MFSLKKALTTAVMVSPLAFLSVPDAGGVDLTGASSTATTEKTEVLMACGKADKGNCSKVVPAIASKVSGGVVVEPANTEGSVESAQLVCKGEIEVGGQKIAVPTAIVQADAADSVMSTQPGCAGNLLVVGQPVYPYTLFAVVRADSSYNDLWQMVKAHRNEGKKLSVSAGKEGSGGLVTLRNLVNADDGVKQTVDIVSLDQNIALQQLENGQLGVFVSMDSPDSDFVEKIRKAVTPDGKQKFKFVDVDLGEFGKLDAKRAFNRPLYQETQFSVPGGWFGRTVNTITTFAAVVANKEWANGAGSKATVSIGKGLDDATALVREATKTPKEWTPPALVR